MQLFKWSIVRWNPWPVFVSDQPSIFTQSDCTETHYHLNTIFKTSINTIQSVKIIHALTEHRQLTHLLTNYSCSNVPFDKKTVEFYFILDQSFGNVSTSHVCAPFKNPFSSRIRMLTVCLLLFFFYSSESIWWKKGKSARALCCINWINLCTVRSYALYLLTHFSPSLPLLGSVGRAILRRTRTPLWWGHLSVHWYPMDVPFKKMSESSSPLSSVIAWLSQNRQGLSVHWKNGRLESDYCSWIKDWVSLRLLISWRTKSSFPSSSLSSAGSPFTVLYGLLSETKEELPLPLLP